MNSQTNFAGTGNRIECRHIALQDIFERQVEDLLASGKKTHRTDRRAEHRGTLAQMAQRMNPQLEERFNEIKSGAVENYLVDHAEWGKFFHEMFSQMPIPSIRYLCIQSGNHAMAVRLRVKNGPQGQSRYVMNFYDPNYTLTEKRFSVDDLEKVKDLQIINFMDKNCIKEYFGDLSNKNCEQVSLFQVVENNFYTQSLGEPRDYVDSDSRSVKMFLPGQKTLYPDVSYHLLAADLSLSELRNQLEKCPRKQVFSFLAAKNSQSLPGRFAAQQYGYVAAIGSHGQVVLGAAEKGLIDEQQVCELLAAKREDGTPGHFMAQQEGYTKAVTSHGQVVLEAAEKGLIDKQQVCELLAAKREDGTPGHFMAQQNGHAAAITAHGEIVLEAAEKGLIDEQQVGELLAAKREDGAPGYFVAQENGHAAAITAQGEIVLEAAKKGFIDKQQVCELLAAKRDDGLPGHFMAQQNGHTAAIASHRRIVLKAVEKGIIDKQQISRLLPPRFARGRKTKRFFF